MTKKINLKTRSLYVAYYWEESDWESRFMHFVASPNTDDDEIEKHFREVVYKAEYDVPLGPEAWVEITEVREARDYDDKKDYKITNSPP
jgi:hypothetical protein